MFRRKPKKIILISCVKTKLQKKTKAKELYISSWFKKSYQYALMYKPDKIFILSAKYGLVRPDQKIKPYELTLKTMKKNERQKWANKVMSVLKKKTNLEKDHFVILAGVDYREFLTPKLVNYEVPMEGLSQGNQMKFLNMKLGI